MPDELVGGQRRVLPARRQVAPEALRAQAPGQHDEVPGAVLELHPEPDEPRAARAELGEDRVELIEVVVRHHLDAVPCRAERRGHHLEPQVLLDVGADQRDAHGTPPDELDGSTAPLPRRRARQSPSSSAIRDPLGRARSRPQSHPCAPLTAASCPRRDPGTRCRAASCPEKTRLALRPAASCLEGTHPALRPAACCLPRSSRRLGQQIATPGGGRAAVKLPRDGSCGHGHGARCSFERRVAGEPSLPSAVTPPGQPGGSTSQMVPSVP